MAKLYKHYIIHITSRCGTLKSHWDATVWILRHFKRSPKKGMVYAHRGHINIIGYSNPYWARDASHRWSTLGYHVLNRLSIIYWKSKKDFVVARSSTQVEYCAMACTTHELFWLKHLLQDLKFCRIPPMELVCDNQFALYFSNLSWEDILGLIATFIWEKIFVGILKTSLTCSKDQLANIFTKSLQSPRIAYICSKLDACDIYAPTRGRVLIVLISFCIFSYSFFVNILFINMLYFP